MFNVYISELIIMLLIDNVEFVGVCDVIDNDGVKVVYQVLCDFFVEEFGNWSCWYKVNQEKMVLGSVYCVFEVVCDLWCCDQDYGVFVGEKWMLVKVWQILISEFVFVQNFLEEDVLLVFDVVFVSVVILEIFVVQF